jgi:DnaB-like helicase C terminal domain/CHC2 zinc finger
VADSPEFPATRRQIIERHPLLEYAQEHGWKLRRDGPRWRCLCPLHREDSPSFVISNNLFRCFGCEEAGSVIDLHAKLHGMTIGEAMRDLWPTDQQSPPRMPRKNPTPADTYDPFEEECSTVNKDAHLPKRDADLPKGYADTPKRNGDLPKGYAFGTEAGSGPDCCSTGNDSKPSEIAAYDYQDATGRVVYQVVRFAPKDFRQARIEKGERVWSMEGVERIPYRLPEILTRPPSLWIVEGEKDVEVLRSIGQVATCNPGGAGKWLPAFSQHLKDSCVYICPDRDEPGQKHGKLVLQTLAGLCAWAKWIELPPEFAGKPIKDVADLRNACRDCDEFIDRLSILQQAARLIDRGIDSDAFTPLELEDQYISENRSWKEISLDLAKWMPKLNVRPLVPGDLLGIVAGTGQLKTAIAQNIVAANPHLPGIFFQLELSGAAMFERMVAITTGMSALEVQETYARGDRIDWRGADKFKNLLTCTETVNMAQIDGEIARSSAKLGCLPKVFVIDYVQLVRGVGSRYDRVSDVCEEAKRLAKKWHMVGIIVSQIARKKGEEESVEIELHDAKGSGSFENSCSLVLGFWRGDEEEMNCRVLKNSRGTAGKLITMKIRGNSYIIEP